VSAPAFGYPIFVEVRDRLVVVVGGGHEAATKATALADLGARVLVCDGEHAATGALAAWPNLRLYQGAFTPELLDGALLVIAASDDRAERRRVAAIARQRGVLVNAVDEVDGCDWSAPAILRRGELTVAIGTGGIAPALAVRVRDRLAGSLGPEYGELLELLRGLRGRIARSGRPFRQRRELWYRLVDGPARGHLAAGEGAAARAALETELAAWEGG
jgi:precorrin-2 dehydrogenase/sirohydrochlorin ferrochelatase